VLAFAKAVDFDDVKKRGDSGMDTYIILRACIAYR